MTSEQTAEPTVAGNEEEAMTFTPGPWIVQFCADEGEPVGFCIIAVIPGQETPTRGQVAYVTTGIGAAFDDVAQARRDASLIAAAPETAEALKQAAMELEVAANQFAGRPLKSVFQSASARAHAVYVKATAAS